MLSVRLDTFREWLDTPPGRMTAGGVGILALSVLVFSLSGYFQGSEAAQVSAERQFICSTSGKPFEYKLKVGDSVPVDSPHSGQKTGYPAELCHWTAAGGIKEEPTLVLLEEYKGSSRGPTFCPDCGRRVVAHNPFPAEGDTPPLTREEYAARASARQKKQKNPSRLGGAAGKVKSADDAEFDAR